MSGKAGFLLRKRSDFVLQQTRPLDPSSTPWPQAAFHAACGDGHPGGLCWPGGQAGLGELGFSPSY